MGIRLDVASVDWGRVADLLEEGYRMVAPRRAIAQLAAVREAGTGSRRE